MRKKLEILLLKIQLSSTAKSKNMKEKLLNFFKKIDTFLHKIIDFFKKL